jgi:hypothetical protein
MITSSGQVRLTSIAENPLSVQRGASVIQWNSDGNEIQVSHLDLLLIYEVLFGNTEKGSSLVNYR